jgi:hypothetical protein
MSPLLSISYLHFNIDISSYNRIFRINSEDAYINSNFRMISSFVFYDNILVLELLYLMSRLLIRESVICFNVLRILTACGNRFVRSSFYSGARNL